MGRNEGLMDARTLPTLLVPLMLAACSQDLRIEGQVIDIWSNPVEGATVVMEGESERPLTDSNGNFSLPATPGAHKIKAGRDGYIQDHVDIEVADGDDLPRPVFKLYPKPEEAGFYVVGSSSYQRLEPESVVQLGGAAFQPIRGIREVGDAVVEGSKLRVLFHTPLKMDQVMRLGVQLHSLEYVHEAEMSGGVEPTLVAVNLYKSVVDVETVVTPLRSRNDYLIESKADVTPGQYAFDTQGLLTPGHDEAFGQIPEPLRVAYPMQVR
jgi:hypothetical protein